MEYGSPKSSPKGLQKVPLPQSKMCAAMCIHSENLMPMLNEDARSHWLGRDNIGYAMIKGN